MDPRQELILETIIKEHINTGVPVGSSVLVEKYKLNISPATVRNDMASLEKSAFIAQPHTSAGRIPTEKAYLHYLSKLEDKKISKTESRAIDDALNGGSENSFKETAKQISQLSGLAVFWAFHKHNLYYTGLSNLFQQPEFSRVSIIQDISSVIDRLDEIINHEFENLDFGLHTLIGTENPFGSIFGTVFVKYKEKGVAGMLGVIGPIRMDYEKVIGMLDYVNNKFIEK
jgi:heat-inducible transcriptional repressor